MVCARQVTVRTDPEFFAQDVGVAPAGGTVRVFEEKEVGFSFAGIGGGRWDRFSNKEIVR